jgi:hypothetical protein
VSDEKPVELSLEEEDALLARGTNKPLPQGAYDPYDVDPRRGRSSAGEAHGRTDLRKLSEWIRLKREIEELKTEEERAAGSRAAARPAKK